MLHGSTRLQGKSFPWKFDLLWWETRPWRGPVGLHCEGVPRGNELGPKEIQAGCGLLRTSRVECYTAIAATQNNKLIFRMWCTIQVDGGLVAWFYIATGPTPAEESKMKFEAQRGRFGIWAPINDERISPWHACVFQVRQLTPNCCTAAKLLVILSFCHCVPWAPPLHCVGIAAARNSGKFRHTTRWRGVMMLTTKFPNVSTTRSSSKQASSWHAKLQPPFAKGHIVACENNGT